MKLGTANIRNFPDMTPGQVARDVRTVARHTSLCGLQEIQVGEDTPVVRDNLPSGWTMVGGHTTSPIVLNGHLWRVLEHAASRTHRPRLSRVENPFLDIVSVTVESRKRPHLPMFAVVNTHLVSGGYNAQHLPDVAAQWDEEWALLAEEVHRLWRDELTVYVVGDLNHPRPPRLNPMARFRWLTPSGPADHIGELENPLSVTMPDSSHEAVELNSDHKLHVLRGGLRII